MSKRILATGVFCLEGVAGTASLTPGREGVKLRGTNRPVLVFTGVFGGKRFPVVGAKRCFTGEEDLTLDEKSGIGGRSPILVLGRARAIEVAGRTGDDKVLPILKKLDLRLFGDTVEGICASVSAVRSDSDGRGRRRAGRVSDDKPVLSTPPLGVLSVAFVLLRLMAASPLSAMPS